MLIKFSISAMAIAAVLTMTNSAIASEAAFKTSTGTVVVTGLTPTQRYQIRTLSAQGKPGSRQDKGVNRCGEIVIEKAANYKTLVVGTITLDPSTLPIKEYVKCLPQTSGRRNQPKGVVRATTPEAR
jgi:hypothetical protein